MKNRMIALVLVSVIVFICFLPAASAWYIDLDDPYYVFSNVVVQSGLTLFGVKWAFSSEAIFGHWTPLTWISHMVVYHFGGFDPAWHHIANIAIHTINAYMVFLFLYRITGNFEASLMVALLFGIHPLRVESVAWISSRKDVLSTFFSMLTLFKYLDFVESRKTKDYILLMGLFICALASKAAPVTIPVIMLLIDIWPLGRQDYTRMISEKITLFVIALMISILTLSTTSIMMNGIDDMPISERIGMAFLNYISYLKYTFYPIGLAAMYPREINFPIEQQIVSACIFGLITLLTLFNKKLFIGWLWFVISILPVSGLFQNGVQRIADRYTYFAAIGLTLGIVCFLYEKFNKKLVTSILTIIILFLSHRTYIQSTYWEDTKTLFTKSLEVQPSIMSMHILAIAALNEGDYESAKLYLTQVVDATDTDFKAIIRLAALVLEDDEPRGRELLRKINREYIIKSEPIEAEHWLNIYDRLNRWNHD